MLPLSDLLQDIGLSSFQACKKVVSKAQVFLQNRTSPNSSTADVCPHESMVTYLNFVTHFLHQLTIMNEVEEVSTAIVNDVCVPYFKILSKNHVLESKQEAATKGLEAVVNALSSLLKQTNSCQQHVMGYISHLVSNVREILSNNEEECKESDTNPKLVLSLMSELFCMVSVDSLEQRGMDLSSLFNDLLNFLRVGEINWCFFLASSVLPHFVTLLHAKRAETMWSFILSVYTGKMSVECNQFELVATLLCCFRDIFIFHDKSSPFSSLFPESVVTRGSPLLDLRKSDTFWCIIQEGLASLDPFYRKRCSYLLHCTLVSVQALAEADCLAIGCEDKVFWWSENKSAELKAVWDDVILVLETMEEKQVSLYVTTVRTHPFCNCYKSCINTAREFSICLCIIGMVVVR